LASGGWLQSRQLTATESAPASLAAIYRALQPIRRASNHGTDGGSTRPAGHDAYVDGNERVELVLFAPTDRAH
jgi:hypothetical protein